MSFRSEYVWLNGKLLPYDDALIHVNTSSLHYGYGVFEGIRAYHTDQGPGVFRLRDHFERFLNSALILGLQDFPYSVDELIEATHQVIRENRYQACYIRPLLFFTESLDLNLDHATPQVSITAWEWGSYLGEGSLEKGVHMGVSSLTRHHMNVNFTKAKITGNYANSVIAKTEAVRNGFDEAIMLDPEGHVAECSGENIFKCIEHRADFRSAVVVHCSNSHCTARFNDAKCFRHLQRIVVAVPCEYIALSERGGDCGRRMTIVCERHGRHSPVHRIRGRNTLDPDAGNVL